MINCPQPPCHSQIAGVGHPRLIKENGISYLKKTDQNVFEVSSCFIDLLLLVV
jgi:hypothetical protein